MRPLWHGGQRRLCLRQVVQRDPGIEPAGNTSLNHEDVAHSG